MFQSRYQTSLWTLIISSLMFFKLDDTRKNELLASWKQLFLEMFVSIDILGPTKRSHQLHSSCQNTLWTLINCCLRYIMCDNTRRNRPRLFHHWKNCLFLNFFSNNLLGPMKMLYMFQSTCQTSLWALINWSLMLVTLDDTRKNDFLSSWKQLFFEMFVSIDLLGPREMILSIAKNLSNYILDPDKLLPDICHVQ